MNKKNKSDIWDEGEQETPDPEFLQNDRRNKRKQARAKRAGSVPESYAKRLREAGLGDVLDKYVQKG